MGLLVNSTPDKYTENQKARDYLHTHGILQFINVYMNAKDRIDTDLRWGDEIEFQVVSYDHNNHRVRLSLRADEIMKDVEDIIKEEHLDMDVKPEYGSYMVEATPQEPYNEFAESLNYIEENMRLRRRIITRVLKDNECVVSIPCFPHLGVGDYFDPSSTLGMSKSSLSYSYPDECVSSFPRFHGLTENIRLRRGKKIDIKVPIYNDINTDIHKIHTLIGEGNSFVMNSSNINNKGITVIPDPVDNYIHMDAMGYGMGCSCLQVTFQTYNVDESRRIYDQMVVIAPYMLAMTACSPVYKGILSDIDTRWTVISQSVDDRTPEELNGPKAIPKSRYDSADLYISKDIDTKLNDTEVHFDPVAFNTLVEHGVDPILAKHISHLFIREALVTYKNYDTVDDHLSSEHFENIQSSNWQSVRWKPPTPNGPVQAWRVELRTMELQLTDFENAAFTVFAGLLERALLYYELDMYIPMSLNEENMKRADKVDALKTQKFWFHRFCVPCSKHCKEDFCAFSSSSTSSKESTSSCCEVHDEYVELSMKEIMGGNCWFPGFIPLIQVYLSNIKLEGPTLNRVYEYLDFIKQRAECTIPTGATFMREYMCSHPDYKHDSIITDKMTYDFMVHIDEINSGYYTDCTHLPSYVVIPPLYSYDSDDSNGTQLSALSNTVSTISETNSMNNETTITKSSSGPKLVGLVDRGYLNCSRVFEKLIKARYIYVNQTKLTPCSCLNRVGSVHEPSSSSNEQVCIQK